MWQYIIQTIAFQVFFLLIYDVFLKKETFFNWNRAYLLITSSLSLVLPFIKIDRFSQVIPKEYVVNLPQVVIGKLTTEKIDPINLEVIEFQEAPIWSWEVLLYVGMAIALLFFLFKMTKLALMIHKNPKQWNNNLLIIKLLKSSKAFSFFHYIFLGERIAPSDRLSILKHEQVHVEQKHTLDLLYFEILRIVFWFNPLVYMYQNRMAELHEFIADAKAVKIQDKKAYYENLLSQVFETQNLSFINPFFKKSLIKKRIVMLSKDPSKQTQLLKYALLIPMVLGMLVYTSTSAQELKSDETPDTVSLSANDNDLKVKYEKELADLEEQGATFKDIHDKFFNSNNSTKYIQTEEEYYRFKAYWNRTFEKMIESKINKGEQLSDSNKAMMERMRSGTYKSYLKYKKTTEAKENWENNVHSGEIRLVVEDHDNYTAEELERYNRKMTMLNNDDWFKQLIITDGVSNRVVTKTSEKNKTKILKKQDLSDLEVPFAVIEQVPVYPGCENLPQKEQKNCMSKQISRYVQKNFNITLAKSLGLKGRVKINTVFKISKEGYVEGIRVRAPHPSLETEVIRVISGLSQMKPGMHKGKPVIVPYSLPIIFQIKDDASEMATTPLIEKMMAMRKQVEIQGNVSDEEQKGFNLLLKAVTGKDFDPALVKDIQMYTASKKKTKLMEKIADVFEQIQVQGNVSNVEEEALKGFLILVTDNGINNPKLKEGVQHVEIPFSVVEKAPVYPGCEGKRNEESKKCTMQAISKHVAVNFDTKLANSLGLTGDVKLAAMFKINNEGKIEGIRAKAPHPALEKEILRIIGSMPQMTPGMHKGKPVNVICSLPIKFSLKD